jgi:CTP synthase
MEGKIRAIKYARESHVPFLGICLGMQAAVIEFTRQFLQRPHANSREFDKFLPEDDAAIVFMPEGDKEVMGGTMRLGARRTILEAGSNAARLYGEDEGGTVDERHRHRYIYAPDLIRHR